MTTVSDSDGLHSQGIETFPSNLDNLQAIRKVFIDAIPFGSHLQAFFLFLFLSENAGIYPVRDNLINGNVKKKKKKKKKII
jgi:hypothetical protein